MPVEFNERENYVLVTLTGETLPANEILQAIQKVVGITKEKGINALIHRKEYAKQKAKTIDFYQFSEYLAEQNVFNLRYAMVFPEASFPENIQFFEMACLNRGVNLRLFSHFEVAEKWLTRK